MKSYDETSVSSNESLTDLKRELARYKEAESHSTSYISDLEARLAKSDESVLSLQQTIARLESESERRYQEVTALQARLEGLEQDGDSWRTNLEERERKVKDLELKMEEWERKRKEADADRLRISGMVGEVEQAKQTLQDLNKTDGSPSSSGVSTPGGVDLSVENQLIALQLTHAATLTDLSAVTVKYRNALQEIADLAAQIQEAKLSNPTIPEFPAPESLETMPIRRKKISLKNKEAVADSQIDSPARKSFFGQAISSESPHGRYYHVSCICPSELTSPLCLDRFLTRFHRRYRYRRSFHQRAPANCPTPVTALLARFHTHPVLPALLSPSPTIMEALLQPNNALRPAWRKR